MAIRQERVTGRWSLMIEDQILDEDHYLDEVPLEGIVTFSPVLPKGMSGARASEPSRLISFRPVRAMVAAGELVSLSGTVSEIGDVPGGPGQDLPAEVDGTTIWWRAVFDLKYNDTPVKLPELLIDLSDGPVDMSQMVSASGWPDVDLSEVDAIIASVKSMSRAAEDAIRRAEEAASAVGEVDAAAREAVRVAGESATAAESSAAASEASAVRAEAGADRVGSAEVVLDARGQATAAATTATGAASTATEQADRATTEADRATTEADRAEAAAGTAAADAAAAAASDAAGLVRADLEAAVAVSASAAAGSAAESEASAVRAEAAAVSVEKPVQMVTSWPTNPSERVLYMMRSGAQINARIGSQWVWSIVDTVVIPDGGSSVSGHLSLRGLSASTATKLPFRLDLLGATNLDSAFRGLSELTTLQPISAPLATNLYSAFRDCSALTSVDLDLPAATGTSSMLEGCKSLTSVDLDLPAATNTSYMLRDCSALTSVDLNAPAATNLSSAFQGCKSLTSVDLSLPAATNTSSMLYDCSALTSVDLDLPAATNVMYMLYGCSSLKSVTLDGYGPAVTSASPGRIDLTSTIITPTAADRLMTGLGTPPIAVEIRLPATAQGCDTTIATAKGWTVTIS